MRICPNCERKTAEPECPDDGFQTVEASVVLGTSDATEPDPFIGTVFQERYRIDRLIDRGAMGRVYEAVQLAVQRRVAIKLLDPELLRTRRAVARFQQEARAIAALKHPNTVRLFDFGDVDGQLFLVMEFLEGESLASIVERDGPSDSRRAVRIMRQVLGALAEAHQGGIVHRDLKPANIFVTHVGLKNDHVKILDFGIAKLHRSDPDGPAKITSVGVTIGSPGYMAPEQITGQSVDARTDIYAVGALLYELMSGAPVFDYATAGECIDAHLREEPPPLTVDGAVLDGPLVDFIMRCLSKDPAKRPQSAAEALAELVMSEEASLVRRAASASDDSTLELLLDDPTPVGTARAKLPAALREASQSRIATGIHRVRARRRPLAAVGMLAAAVTFGIGLFFVLDGLDEGRRGPTVDLVQRDRPISQPASQPANPMVQPLTAARAAAALKAAPASERLASLPAAAAGAAPEAPTAPAVKREQPLREVAAEPETTTPPDSEAATGAEPTDAAPTDSAPTEIVLEEDGLDEPRIQPGAPEEGVGRVDDPDPGPTVHRVRIESKPPARVYYRRGPAGRRKLCSSTPCEVEWQPGTKPPALVLRRRGFEPAYVRLKASEDGGSRKVQLYHEIEL